MRSVLVSVLASVVCTLGCGGSNPPQQSTVAPPPTVTPPPMVEIKVAPVGTGTGHVLSRPVGIDCPKTCTMEVPAGTAVDILPTADTTSGLRGFGGGCSGTNPCTVIASANRTVWVNFAHLAKLSVGVTNGDPTSTIAGGLTVTSVPAGMTCTATSCSGMFMMDEPVVLTAVPIGGSTFAGWSGVCTGAGDCTLTLTADTAAVATYKPPPPDDCLGVMPAMPGTPVERTLTPGTHSFCENAVSDQKGNVAVNLTGQGWILWSADGTSKGTVGAAAIWPQASGFQGVSISTTLTDALFVWASDGSVVQKTDLLPHDPAASSNEDLGFPAVTGGTVVLSQRCYMPPAPAVAKTDLFVSRFDEAGTLVSRSVNIGGDGCGYTFAISDALNRTLVLGVSGGTPTLFGIAKRLAARWLDRNGTPLTDWFDGGTDTIPAGIPFPMLRPMIGGGVLFPDVGSQQWVAFPSGQAKVDAAPKFVIKASDVAIVRGGKAYALFQSGSLELYSPAGKRCGSVQVRQGADLRVGADGTVIALSGPGSCTIDWWSALLK
jgi:List-Bact-rpt repeat protein